MRSVKVILQIIAMIISVPILAFVMALIAGVISALFGWDFDAAKSWNDNLYLSYGLVVGYAMWGWKP